MAYPLTLARVSEPLGGPALHPWSAEGTSIEIGGLYASAFNELVGQYEKVLDDSTFSWGSDEFAFSSTLRFPDIAFVGSYVSHEVPSSLKAVDRLRKMMGWRSNWDGENAPAPSVDTLESAILVVGFLTGFGLDVHVDLDCRGNPMIFFHSKIGEGEITVVNANALEFAIQGSQADAEVDVPFGRYELPNDLIESLRQAGMI